MWSGKLIGALAGMFLMGPFGLLLGLVAGHFYDSFQRAVRFGGPAMNNADRQLVQRSFFETSFQLLGYVAKADGRVSETEVAHTEELMRRMGLTADHRLEAITFFKSGCSNDFDLTNCLESFNRICGRHPRLKQSLLSYLITLALADGQIDSGEQAALEKIAAGLGIPAFVFQQLLGMIGAQSRFHQQRGDAYGPSAADKLQTAYEALGVTAQASDGEIKKAYRKLISENHPDKLIGQGLPEDMVKLATERSQEIRSAYELIVDHRKAAA